MTVTGQRTVEPQVADLGTLADTAEESAHTLAAAAGGAVQVSGNGNLVILGIERTGEGSLVFGSANQAVALGTIGSIVNICGYHGIGSVVAGIN